MEKEYKVIFAHIFKPHKSIFKNSKNHKAECQVIECSNSENCGSYARGECTFRGVFGKQKCPYGRYYIETGYTSRARNYYSWIKNKEEQYKDVSDKLNSHKDMLATIGDYVFLPYSHITMNESIPFLAHGGAFRIENRFLPKEHFTIDNIISICDFRPQALFGGEITSYQKEVVPKFLKHLSEIMPDVFKELSEKYDRATNLIKDYSYIGRKAFLNTLTPYVGKFVDVHKAEWVWDGMYLTSVNCKTSFMPVKDFSEIRIKPLDSAVMKITDEGQVNKNTKFVD